MQDTTSMIRADLRAITGCFKLRENRLVPIGAVSSFAGPNNNLPSGWLLCDGSNVSRTTYYLLFLAIGTTYGAGDGSTTFTLPNLKGKIPVGLDASQTEFDTLGETGGEKAHTLTTNEMPSHSHTINDPSHTHTYTTRTGNQDTDNAFGTEIAANETTGTINTSASTTGITINNTGGGQAHNNLQPYIVLNYMIKY